jgi:hypothetical protein
MGVYLTGVYLMGMRLNRRAPRRRVLHGCASHEHAPHGRVSHGRILRGSLYCAPQRYSLPVNMYEIYGGMILWFWRFSIFSTDRYGPICRHKDPPLGSLRTNLSTQ